MSLSPYFENIEKTNSKLQWTVSGGNTDKCTSSNANTWYFYFGITSQVFDIFSESSWLVEIRIELIIKM